MKEHIERLRKLAASAPSACNTVALGEAIGELAGIVADALGEFEPCTDCTSKQGEALTPAGGV